MKHNGIIDIATGLSAKSKKWKNRKIAWSDLAEKLMTANVTPETNKAYIAATKSERSKIKDVGGYVGGFLRGNRRKPANVVHRQLLTLDLDYATEDFWEDYEMLFENAAVIHATHSHTPDNPRFRLIIPLSRTVAPDEYQAIARKVAGMLDIELFDSTTFEINRLMFWPSNSIDVEYYAEIQDGPWLDADYILDMYVDWKDISQWPNAKKQDDDILRLNKNQEDPQLKKGLVGSFCRTYSLTEAIEKYLSDVYIPTDHDDRYTFANGSTAGGLIIYDDKFAYSHHGSDPCMHTSCNAFDLVRIHLFGHFDEGPVAAKSKPKSFKAMIDLVQKDEAVKATMAIERQENIAERYADEFDDDFLDDFEDEDDNPIEDWGKQLALDERGKIKQTIENANLILQNDKLLRNAFSFNEFSNRKFVVKRLPRESPKLKVPRLFSDIDSIYVRAYVETAYEMTNGKKVDEAIDAEFNRKLHNPIKDYLNTVKWDGTPRLETALIDYFDVESSPYHLEALKVTMTAAVARIFKPGTKFDLVLVLSGAQGCGKSTLVHKLGNGWSSDTFMTVHGKESFEQLQGAWIIEMAELAGLRKAEVENIKHFISKQEDTFRPAYAKEARTFKRQCVFIGTTNSDSFLTDSSGNRRFMPIAIPVNGMPFESVFDISQETVDQLWAEAKKFYDNGAPLTLSREATKGANITQQDHAAEDPHIGLLTDFLNRKLPANWKKTPIGMRQMHLQEDPEDDTGKPRSKICSFEIWCEYFNQPKRSMTRRDTYRITDLMQSLKGWKRAKGYKNFKYYGKQRYYERC